MLAVSRLVPGGPLAPSAGKHQAAGRQVAAAAPDGTAPATPSPSPTPSPSLPPLDIAPTEVDLDVDGWWSWAMLDRRTGEIAGSANLDQTSTTASLIKAWIAADVLRAATADGRTPNDYRMWQLEIMIRDSDNAVAEQLWQEIGRSAAIDRMVAICALTDSSSTQNRWSTTMLSPRDVARLGDCIADGRAAGPEWTDWLLQQMRSVRSPGNFGVIQAFPEEAAAGIAIKNGWVIRDADREWHVNCLAIGDGWTLGVMVRFPTSRPYTYGAEVCRGVTGQLRAAAAAAAPA
ncbi:serine hydrolase [Solwaraspora sp. WMMB335]|uniref:serine hydrolase n=1 Tax=Solwaraspora sp. WMMB335 TaxID=3404118 RepID=UPI003B928885